MANRMTGTLSPVGNLSARMNAVKGMLGGMNTQHVFIEYTGINTQTANVTINNENRTIAVDVIGGGGPSPVARGAVLYSEVQQLKTSEKRIARQNIDALRANPLIAAAIHTKIAYDENGLILSGTDLQAADIPSELNATSFNGDITVEGNIIQKKGSYETHIEKIYTKNDLIFMRDQSIGALLNNEYTGLIAKVYDGVNDGALIYDKHGVARVGDVSIDYVALTSLPETRADYNGYYYKDEEAIDSPYILINTETPNSVISSLTVVYKQQIDATNTQPLLTRDEITPSTMIDNKFVRWDVISGKVKTSDVQIEDVVNLSQRLHDLENESNVQTFESLGIDSSDYNNFSRLFVAILEAPLVESGSIVEGSYTQNYTNLPFEGAGDLVIRVAEKNINGNSVSGIIYAEAESLTVAPYRWITSLDLSSGTEIISEVVWHKHMLAEQVVTSWHQQDALSDTFIPSERLVKTSLDLLDASVVHKAGSETITGVKTFHNEELNADTIISGSSIVTPQLYTDAISLSGSDLRTILDDMTIPRIVFTPSVINVSQETVQISGILEAVNALYKSGGIFVQILSSESAGNDALGMLGMIEFAISSTTRTFILHAIPPVLKPKITNILFKQASFNIVYDATSDTFTSCTLASLQTGTPPLPVDNTTVYTPTGDYNPATKKYVDDYTQSLQQSISNIEGKIPTTASVSNQLADKAFVNSSINAMAAFYITSNVTGDAFATKASLVSGPYYYQGIIREITQHDYAIVLTDETKNNACTRYSYDGVQWDFQYIVNDTPFTQDQLNALNSGINTNLVSQIHTHSNKTLLDGISKYIADASVSGNTLTLFKDDNSSVIFNGVTSYSDLTNKPKLNTTNSSELSTSASEELFGTINLHKIAKTGKASDLLNDGDGTSSFATESYVDTYGGKIDEIYKNGDLQTITDKKVYLTNIADDDKVVHLADDEIITGVKSITATNLKGITSLVTDSAEVTLEELIEACCIEWA